VDVYTLKLATKTCVLGPSQKDGVWFCLFVFPNTFSASKSFRGLQSMV